MKILVCGSRKWVEQAPLERELRRFPPGTILVHGAARGADNIAGYVGKRLGLIIRPYPANWERDGKFSAGPIRNSFMLEQEHPDKDGVCIDLALAFHKDPSLGKGTKDMVAKLRKAIPSIQVEVFLR